MINQNSVAYIVCLAHPYIFVIRQNLLFREILCYLRRPQTVPTCWTTFEPTLLVNMLARFAILYFSKQKATNIFGFSSICLLTVKNARVWSSSMFDNRPHDRRWWQKSTWLNKKVDTVKRRGRDLRQPYSEVIGWGYKDIQGDD